MSSEPSLIDLQKQKLRLMKTQLARSQAKDSLLRYLQLQMPDPADIENTEISRFVETPQARLLCQIMEKVERGELKRVAVAIGPQLGKSQVISRGFPAWCTGRDPYRNLMLGTYNQTFAEEFGGEVRDMIESPLHRAIFPAHVLQKGALDLMVSQQGGKTAFVGVGGSGTGKPADFFVVDDPIRSDDDAQSQLYRDRIWKWFNAVVFTRCHSKSGIVVVHCLTGDTQITMADGSLRPMRDLRVGDRIATYKGGQISTSQVLNWANQGPDQVFTIVTRSGATVTANERHPFLVERAQGTEWVKLRDLKIGDKVLRVIGGNGGGSSALTTDATSPRSAKDTASRTTTSFDGKVECALRQTTLSHGEKHACGEGTASMPASTTSCSPSKTENAQSAGNLQRQMSAPIGAESYASTIATIPARSEDCFATTAISQSDTEKRNPFCTQPLSTCEIIPDTIEEIVAAGREDVFDIQVADTENFIANGLVSHNTRWHEDDLIGRLCDPAHPERDKEYAGIADDWTYINLPAVVDDPKLAARLGLTLEPQVDPRVVDQFGDKPISSLWPERKGLPFLAEAKRMDPRTFEALYMGHPAREDGEYFNKAMLVEYDAGDLPPEHLLTIYGASDHAVSTKQGRDPSVLGCVGVDANEDIWVLPDLVWRRMETDKTVEELLHQFKTHRPQIWWMESELISKSFGPFLHKRMTEDRVFVTIDKVVPSKDKQTRARAIQGRMSMKKVRFPRFAPWYSDARRQLLAFPYASHDDFVDWLAHIGMGLMKTRGNKRAPANENREGTTIDFILKSSLARGRQEQFRKAVEGW